MFVICTRHYGRPGPAGLECRPPPKSQVMPSRLLELKGYIRDQLVQPPHFQKKGSLGKGKQLSKALQIKRAELEFNARALSPASYSSPFSLQICSQNIKSGMLGNPSKAFYFHLNWFLIQFQSQQKPSRGCCCLCLENVKGP